MRRSLWYRLNHLPQTEPVLLLVGSCILVMWVVAVVMRPTLAALVFIMTIVLLCGGILTRLIVWSADSARLAAKAGTLDIEVLFGKGTASDVFDGKR